ncbi:MAG: M48 family metallopeptidase [Bdellovibrionales bacterium]|nr:M48 family metallopeptidase [Bdellovibrionales bacterium]
MLYFVIAIILFSYILDVVVETLNLKRITTQIPSEFVGLYDQEKYIKSQEYLRTNTRFGLVQSTVSTLLLLAFIFLDGFIYLDNWVRLQTNTPILQGLLFIGAFVFASMLIALPFSYYHTFVIEEKFGFNKQSKLTFVKDQILGLVLGAILGGGLLSLILWFFESSGQVAWLYCWVAVVLFQIFVTFIAPVVIMPLFNKFVPLPDGELKSAINDYAKNQNFELQGIFSMDGSKRSSKANAFFTGFGKLRRVVLFDTLISKHSIKELVAVLAHEIGHFKMKHIHRHLIVSICSSGVMFYLMGLFMKNEMVFSAFHMENVSVYASLIFFSLVYSPVSDLTSLISLHMSRKYEFEADAYAVKTYGHPEALADAPKKLSVDSLSNLNPHPLKVFFEYTHPPVIERVKKLQSLSIQR